MRLWKRIRSFRDEEHQEYSCPLMHISKEQVGEDDWERERRKQQHEQLAQDLEDRIRWIEDEFSVRQGDKPS